jgi:2'-5' RNA ligase
MARLFLAVWPDAEVRARLDALPRPEEPGVRWVPPAQWHVTLRFLGEADEHEVGDALTGLRVEPATATYGPAVSRLGRTVLCVPVRGLDAVVAAAADATTHLGEPPDPRPFAGHLTLARLRNRGSCRLAGHRVTAEQYVTYIDLVASRLGSDGPSYQTVTTVALGV